jgi:hypothetical protein
MITGYGAVHANRDLKPSFNNVAGVRVGLYRYTCTYIPLFTGRVHSAILRLNNWKGIGSNIRGDIVEAI